MSIRWCSYCDSSMWADDSHHGVCDRCVASGNHNGEPDAPLDAELNHAIVHMAWRVARGFTVSSDAPSSFEALCAHMDAGKPLVVWDGASDNTIFGGDVVGVDGARVNYCFRAWHDYHHWRGRLPFTPDGELEACRRQQDDLLRVFGDSPRVREWCRIVHAEVVGQGQYLAYHNKFPRDQKAFVQAYLIDMEAVKSVF